MITLNYNTSGALTVVPSEMSWSLMSVNAANSGRTSDGTMITNRVTQKRKLELAFNGVTWAKASQILNAVNSENFQVYYPDMLTGTYTYKTFYVGDREAPVWCWFDPAEKKILASLKFNLIEV